MRVGQFQLRIDKNGLQYGALLDPRQHGYEHAYGDRTLLTRVSKLVMARDFWRQGDEHRTLEQVRLGRGPNDDAKVARLALQVRLPDGLHVQSNKPRDPSLIATVLTLDPPPGIIVEESVYPPARDLAQSGQAQPLAVFGQES